MSDNYLQSSFAIQDITDEEAAWLDRVFLSMDSFEQDDASEIVQTFLKDLFTTQDLSDLSWGWTLNKREDTAYIYSEETCDPDAMATVLQRFLLRFRQEQQIAFSWAETCSNPRVNEFGGGAVIVTVIASEWMSVWDWLLEKQED